MSDRPTEEMNWAEGEGAEAVEPENLREQGWPFGFVPPAEHVNWLQRAAGRWIKWLTEKVDLLDYLRKNHLHDGGEEPESAPKVAFNDHIDFGENGLLAKIDQPNGNHTILHYAPTGSAIFETDLVLAGNARLAEITSPSGATPPQILVSGALKEFDEDEFSLKVLGSLEISEDVEIEGGLMVDGAVNALNTPRAWCRLGDGGVLLDGYGIDEIDRLGPGQYQVKLSDPPQNEADISLVATANTFINDGIWSVVGSGSDLIGSFHATVYARKLNGIVSDGSSGFELDSSPQDPLLGITCIFYWE